jgi:hypothetical protein
MRFMVGKVALGRVIHSDYVGFRLPISFHHCTILILFVILLLSEGQEGDALKTLEKAVLSQISVSNGRKGIVTLFGLPVAELDDLTR